MKKIVRSLRRRNELWTRLKWLICWYLQHLHTAPNESVYRPYIYLLDVPQTKKMYVFKKDRIKQDIKGLGSSPEEKEYWKTNGWLDKKRPWNKGGK